MSHDQVGVRTSENVEIGYRTAGLGSRLIAQILDRIIIVGLLIVALIGVAALTSGSGVGSSLGPLLLAGVVFFIDIGYFLVAEALTAGRTPGKASVNLRVIRRDGAACGVQEAVVRNVLRLVDEGFLVGPLVMFFNPRSQRLGDLLANTVVVHERPASQPMAAAGPPVLLRSLDPGPPLLGIEQMGTKEYSAVRAFLSRPGLPPDQRYRLAWTMAQKLLDRLQLPADAPERVLHPELFLERVYLQLHERMA